MEEGVPKMICRRAQMRDHPERGELDPAARMSADAARRTLLPFYPA